MKTSQNLSLFILFFSISCVSQQRVEAKFGEPTFLEKEMMSYDKDKESPAVVLFESGKNHVEVINNRISLVKQVHRKIKVFDPSRFEHGEVEIYYYKTSKTKEKVVKLEAITHNGGHKTFVTGKAIYDIDINENWGLKRFTFPNIKKGSILEYTYEIETPYFFNFGDWKFQNDLPKLYTEFYAEIPGNFRYNRVLYGIEDLYLNQASIKKRCFSIASSSSRANCEVLLYAMKDLPAFKEEKYMLAGKNYKSRISFELQDYTDFQGYKEVYSKNWNDVDREFKHDKDLGRQLNYTNYFKDKLPANILTIQNPLERAKAVFSFIQNHFAWNGNYRVFSDIRVKDAFDEKTGNIAEINLSLINSLEAADLNAKIMMISTRENGLPTLLYPVLTDFNYVAVLLSIGDNKYVLDATDRNTSFDVLPYRDLNIQGRVLDFRKGSYWHPIEPNKRNVHYLNSQLEADDNGNFTGNVNEIYSGHIGVQQRKAIIKVSDGNYIQDKSNGGGGFSISDLKIENRQDPNKALKESYNVTIETELVGENVYFYPFFMEPYFKANPFTENTRKYPMDFGFPVVNTYLVSAKMNGKYEVLSLPKSRIYKLPENAGECSVAYSSENDQINLRLNVKLNEYRFTADYYNYLKEFFSNLIAAQSKEPIVLKQL
ncbi:MAG: hypothetical protein ACI840_001629 [Ulvibacter sp.]|jgi:hypothetical protein